VAGYDDDTHEVMRSLLKEKIPPVPASGFAVAPSLEQLHRISASVTGETSLVKLLKRFVHNIDVPDGFFYPRITEDQNERAEWLDTLAAIGGREIHAVAGADFEPGADAAKRLGALGAGAGEEKGHEADAAFAGTVLDEPAGGGRHLPHVFGLCLARVSPAGFFPRASRLAQRLAREASERVDSLLQQQNAAARKRAWAVLAAGRLQRIQVEAIGAPPDRHQADAILPQPAKHQEITGIFHQHRVARLQETAADQVDCVRAAKRGEYMAGVNRSAHAAQQQGDLLAQLRQALGRAARGHARSAAAQGPLHRSGRYRVLQPGRRQGTTAGQQYTSTLIVRLLCQPDRFLFLARFQGELIW
jgi:hypothetical protein